MRRREAREVQCWRLGQEESAELKSSEMESPARHQIPTSSTRVATASNALMAPSMAASEPPMAIVKDVSVSAEAAQMLRSSPPGKSGSPTHSRLSRKGMV